MTEQQAEFLVLDGRLIRIEGRLIHLHQHVREVLIKMSALTDAVQAVADDQKRIADDVSKVLGLLTQPNPDVAAAVTALQAVKDSQDASAAALEAALPPAPATAEGEGGQQSGPGK